VLFFFFSQEIEETKDRSKMHERPWRQKIIKRWGVGSNVSGMNIESEQNAKEQ
jgi:hypothetical protein